MKQSPKERGSTQGLPNERSVLQTLNSHHATMIRNDTNQSEWVYNRTLLVDLNAQMMRDSLPAIVFLAVLMLIGSVGNSLTIYIYGRRFKSSTQNCLFTWLGVFDLSNCLFGIPSEIVDIFLHLIYESAVMCKILRFVLAFCSGASVSMLVVIAVDRYLRVCKPLHSQMEGFHVKIGVGMAAVGGVVMAGPAALLHGRRSVRTSVVGIKGNGCSVQDKYHGHLFFTLYQTALALVFISLTSILATLYIHMWREIRRCRQFSSDQLTPVVALSSLKESEEHSGSANGNCSENSDVLSRTEQSEIFVKVQKSIRASKSMWIALAVTVLFVFSYLPYLIIMLLRTMIANFDGQQKGVNLALYHTFLRSHFINSVANVFIYSGMSSSFRSQCKQIICTCWGRRQQRRQGENMT